MSALTDHVKRLVQMPDSPTQTEQYNVAASTTIYNGAIVTIDGSGNLIPFSDRTMQIFIGIAAEGGYDNSAVASATTGKPCKVQKGQVEKMVLSGAAATDVGQPVYPGNTDNPADITKTIGMSGLPASEIGTIRQFVSGTTVMVDTNKSIT